MGQRKKKKSSDAGGSGAQEDGAVRSDAATGEGRDEESRGGDQEASLEADGLAVLREENEKLRDNWLRAVAELDNFRKRAARDRQREVLFARTGVIVPLLEVLDDMERAADHEGASADDLKKGLGMTREKFIDKLSSIGVEPIVSIGKPFDPETMDALATIPSADSDPGTVIAEIRKGYVLNDAVIRHAQVSVAAACGDEG